MLSTDEDGEDEEAIKAAEVQDSWEDYQSRRFGMTREQYLSAVQSAEHIKKECDYQDHLHGETTPTSPTYISQECYLGGWRDGYWHAFESILKRMGLWEEYKKKVDGVETLRWRRKMRKLVFRCFEGNDVPSSIEHMETFFGGTDDDPE